MTNYCEFEGCNRKIMARGLCQGHYTQRRYGRELSPLRPKKNSVAAKNGMKLCRICEEWKPIDNFYNSKSPTGRTYKLSYCKPCWNNRGKVARAEKAVEKAMRRLEDAKAKYGK